MKHIPLVVFVIVFLFGILGTLLQFEKQNLTGLFFHEQKVRVFIFPKTHEDFFKTKFIPGISLRHEFDNFFSADVKFDSLKKVGELAFLEEVPIFQILAQDNERNCLPSEQISWNVKKVNGGKGGEGVNVAILDTGISEHKDLIAGLCVDMTKEGINKECFDDNGHGTHLAGIISGFGGKDGKGIFGVAPGANLQVLKVCNDDGACFADDVFAGLQEAVQQNSKVVLMSFGMPRKLWFMNDFFENHKDILFIGASGEKRSMLYPAFNENVISVQAVDENDNVIKYFEEIDFVSPGVNVESTAKNGCYTKMTGSSVGAAHVAGIAAVLWNENAVKTAQLMKEKAVLTKLVGKKFAVI